MSKSKNPALVRDYEAEGLKVYLKDIRYDAEGRPVILYITSKGYQSGPRNDPRTWTIARWNGRQWKFHPVTTSDNNYDMGSLWIEPDGRMQVIGPTQTGPQPYNPGGEMALWQSSDDGGTWTLTAQITKDSERNHTYARRALGGHPDFAAIWADGHGRKPSPSTLYFCNDKGTVFELPRSMSGNSAKPRVIGSRRE